MSKSLLAHKIEPGMRIDFYVGRIPYTDTVFATHDDGTTVTLTISGKRQLPYSRTAWIKIAQDDRPNDPYRHAMPAGRQASTRVRGISID